MTIKSTNPWSRLSDSVLIAPSLLACDFAHVSDDIDSALAGGAEVLHIDIMDGHFVPNLSMGPGFAKKIREYTNCFLDVHLMVTDPEYYAEQFAKSGADSITFHVEATDNPTSLIERIRQMGIGCGICIKPSTNPDSISDVIAMVDMVLVMTVEPGYGGQAFMSDQLGKIEIVKNMLQPGQRLEVDGGIDAATAKLCASYGADVYVAGNSVFGSVDIARAIGEIKKSALLGMSE